MHSIKQLITALFLTVLGMGVASASDNSDVMTVVGNFVDAFNKGDTKSAAAACADQTSIIDEFAPYEWHGTGGCSKWMEAYDADAKSNGITDGVVTLGKVRHVAVSGDHAYVVVHANYVFKKKGKEVKEIGSMLTIALQKVGGGWRFVGWAWAKH